MKFIYFGSSGFSRIILETLCKEGLKPLLVVSQPDKPKGRGLRIKPTEVSEFSSNHELALIKPSSLKTNEVQAHLAGAAPDLFIVADYGKILPMGLLTIPKILPLAVHPSLLPKYRGPAPINWALINGDNETGVTIFKMNETLDNGNIILQRSISIGSREDAITLHTMLANASARLLIESLKNIELGSYVLRVQDERDATFARKLTKDDGKINWDFPANKIQQMIRGTMGWPSMHMRYHEKIIKIIEVECVFQASGSPAGTITCVDKEGICVATVEGTLRIKKIQPEGKKLMDAWAFVIGHHVKAGDRFY